MPSRRALLRRAVLALCAPILALPARRVLAQGLPVVRVVGPINDGQTPLYYGLNGLFRRYGIDVQLMPANNGAAAMAAVLGGSAEIAFTNMVAVLQAHLRGVPVQIVAPLSIYSSERPPMALVVLKDAPYHSGKDLNGKTISSPSVRDLNSVSVMAWVDKTGGDSKTLQMVEVPSATALPALEEGRIDGATMIEPAVSQALATGKARILCHPEDAIAARYLVTAYAADGRFVDQNHELMASFARAMHEASVYVNSHVADTVDLVAARTGATPDEVAHSVRSLFAEYADARTIVPLLDVLVKYGLVDHGFPVGEIISSVAVKPPHV